LRAARCLRCSVYCSVYCSECCSVYCSVCCSVRCGELRCVLRMSKEGRINSCEMPVLQCVLLCVHIHKRAPQKSPLYISAKEPYMYPQKNSIHIRKRALYTYLSAKASHTYPQKRPVFICKRERLTRDPETSPRNTSCGSRIRLSDSY